MDASLEIVAGEAAAGVIRITGLSVGPAPDDLKRRMEEAAAAAATPYAGEEEAKKAVRSLLRFGKYKPSGRGKPASEYLLESAREGAFPSINNAVDALNLVSMRSQLPISLIDTQKAGGTSFRLRRGREGEEFVFNRSGQVLGLQDLLLVSVLPSDEPLASPVKDCQRTKVDEGTREALAVIYAPKGMTGLLKDATRDLGMELSLYSKIETAIFGCL